MLRTWKVLPARASTLARSATVLAAVAAAVLVAGLRSPLVETPAAAQVRATASGVKSAQPAASFDTRFVSDDGGTIIAVRPARIFNHETLAEIRKTLDQTVFKDAVGGLGFHPADVDQLILTSNIAFATPHPTSVFLRTNKAVDFSRIIQQLAPRDDGQPKTRKIGDSTIILVPQARPGVRPDGGAFEARGIWQPDERTLVLDTIRRLRRYISGERPTQRLLKSDRWNEIKDRDAVLLADQESLQQFLKIAQPVSESPLGTMLVNPLVNKTRQTSLAIRWGDKLSVEGIAASRTAEDATNVSESLNAARVLARNMLEEWKRAAAGADQGPDTPQNRLARDPVLQKFAQFGSRLLTQMKIQQDETVTRITMRADVEELQLAVIAPAIVAARKSAQRMSSMNNLRQIALAFHNYHAVYKRFPGSRFVPEGKTHPISWRVAILPYIEQQPLYEQYNFDEPWDSEHNRKLIAHMPPVYRHPSTPADSTSPSYYVLTGPATIFRDGKPRLRDIRDGTSNTILAVEAKRAIPWTKPEDIAFDEDKPVPTIGGYSPQGFNTVFADGAARFIAKSIDPKLLKLLIMSSDGNPVPNLD